MVRTSSSSRGFVSWSLSNVVSPALTRVVLSVRPQERKGENQGQGLGEPTPLCTQSGALRLHYYFPLPILSSCFATYLEFSHSLQGQRHVV